MPPIRIEEIHTVYLALLEIRGDSQEIEFRAYGFECLGRREIQGQASRRALGSGNVLAWPQELQDQTLRSVLENNGIFSSILKTRPETQNLLHREGPPRYLHLLDRHGFIGWGFL